MRPDRFTTKTQEALQAAHTLAAERGHAELSNEHLARAFVDQTDGVTRPLLEKVGVTPDKWAQSLDDELNRRARTNGGGDPGLSRGARQTIDAAEKEMAKLKDEYLSAEHYLLALADSSDPAGRSLKALG